MADRTPEGRVVIFEKSTGERLERWPVDARALLSSGLYTETDPKVSPPTDKKEELHVPTSPHLTHVREVPINPALAKSEVSLADAKKAGELAPGVPLDIAGLGTSQVSSTTHPLSEPTRTTGKKP